MAAFYLDLIFDVSVVYIFLISVFTSIVEKSTTTFYGFYYLALVGLCALWTSFEIKKYVLKKEKASTLSNKYILSFLTATSAFVLLYWHARGSNFFSMEVWVDEIIQAFCLGLRPIWDITHTAAYQQQPPTDYFLSRFGIMLFGKSEIGVRFHSILFGILGSCFFILTLNKFKLPKWFQIPYIFSFLYQSLLVNYASQARPISLSVYFFIYLVALVFREPEGHEPDSKRLLIAFSMLLLSIGLQPIIACLSLIPMVYFTNLNNQNKFFKKYIKIFILAMIGTLPIMINIYNESKRANQFYDVNYLTSAITSLLNITASKVAFYFKLFSQTEITWLLPLILILVSLVSKTLKKHDIKLIIWPTLGWLLFHMSFVGIFLALWSIINWPLLPRYFVLLFVGGILLSAYVVGIISTSIDSKNSKIFGIKMACCVLISMLQIIIFYIPMRAGSIVNQSKHLSKMRAIYQTASNNSRNELFLPIPYVLVGSESTISGTKSTGQIYLQSKYDSIVSNCFRRYAQDGNLLVYRPFLRKPKSPLPNDLIFYIDITQSEVLPPEILQRLSQLNTFQSYGKYPDILIYRIPIETDANTTIEKLLLTFIDIEPKGEQNFFLLESLIDYYNGMGRINEAKRLFSRLESLTYRDKMTNEINYYLYNTEVKVVIEKIKLQLYPLKDDAK